VGDAIFNDPRLVRVYDAIEGDRRDLEVYVELVDELGARSVLDIGCGTGTFACMLAGRGIDVVGVDPASASLEIARAKPGADAVCWLHGDATTLPPVAMDAAFMTGNVAQVFLTDDDWAATLLGTREALRPGGHLVFETRDPARRGWERWTPELTRSVLDVPGVGVVEDWGELTEVSSPFVTFRSTTVFRRDDLVLESTSTLRFRDRPEIENSLVAAGFRTVEIRDAPDRPGLEFVYLAVRPD
jgi:SAM-dependent methyltransferase